MNTLNVVLLRAYLFARKKWSKVTALFALMLFFLFGLTNPAYADPPDFSTLTAAVDYSTVITALLAIFAALAGVFIVMSGGGMIVSRIRGGR